MKTLTFASIAIVCMVGCNMQRVEVLKSRTSPDGRWVIAAEFDHRKGRTYVILRDANGATVAETKGMLVDHPADYQPDDLLITNETAGTCGREGTSYPEWQRNANTDAWDSALPDSP